MSRDADQLLAELTEVGAAIAEAEAILRASYPKRLSLFQEGKAMDPPIVNRVLGEAAGCDENAVIAALRKAKAKAAAATEKAPARARPRPPT